MNLIKVDDIVYLREIQLSDAEKIYSIIDSEREYLGEWLPFIKSTVSVEYTREYVRAIVENPERETENVFVILYDKEVIGLIGFVGSDRPNNKSEIGYWISEKYQHLGIVTRSVGKLLDYAFNTLGINKIKIKAAVGNMKSKRIPQRLGFRLEGIERDGELQANGLYADLEVYGLLKREHEAT